MVLEGSGVGFNLSHNQGLYSFHPFNTPAPHAPRAGLGGESAPSRQGLPRCPCKGRTTGVLSCVARGSRPACELCIGSKRHIRPQLKVSHRPGATGSHQEPPGPSCTWWHHRHQPSRWRQATAHSAEGGRKGTGTGTGKLMGTPLDLTRQGKPAANPRHTVVLGWLSCGQATGAELREWAKDQKQPWPGRKSVSWEATCTVHAWTGSPGQNPQWPQQESTGPAETQATNRRGRLCV